MPCLLPMQVRIAYRLTWFQATISQNKFYYRIKNNKKKARLAAGFR